MQLETERSPREAAIIAAAEGLREALDAHLAAKLRHVEADKRCNEAETEALRLEKIVHEAKIKLFHTAAAASDVAA